MVELKFIKSKSVPLAIFTGKGRKTSLITLENMGMLDYFDLIISGDDVQNHKPSPDGLFRIINHYKFEPEEMILIGDAPSDIKAAKSAGVKSATVLWGVCFSVLMLFMAVMLV